MSESNCTQCHSLQKFIPVISDVSSSHREEFASGAGTKVQRSRVHIRNRTGLDFETSELDLDLMNSILRKSESPKVLTKKIILILAALPNVSFFSQARYLPHQNQFFSRISVLVKFLGFSKEGFHITTSQ